MSTDVSCHAVDFIRTSFAPRQSLWETLVASAPEATLYHDARWLRLLEQAYGFDLHLAAVTEGSEIKAGCVLARTKNPFRPRMVSLPFSDGCPPLAFHRLALKQLFEALIGNGASSHHYEIRGIDLGPPWHVVNCFADWQLDLTRPLLQIERGSDRNFRRQLRRAIGAGLSVKCGASRQELLGFFRIMSETRRRLGVPVQPLRFFERVREIFSLNSDLEIWSVFSQGRLLASSLLLRSRKSLHVKWSARRPDLGTGANHLLFWSIIEQHAGKGLALHLGRTDIENVGLNRFKRELGAQARPLPYSYFPQAAGQVSSEVMSGASRWLAQIWRRLPLSATQVISSALYKYLA